MSDLFPDLPETLSPKAAWKRRHGVEVDEREDWDAADGVGLRWLAWKGECCPSSPHAFGETEDDALQDLAKVLNIPMWWEGGGE